MACCGALMACGGEADVCSRPRSSGGLETEKKSLAVHIKLVSKIKKKSLEVNSAPPRHTLAPACSGGGWRAGGFESCRGATGRGMKRHIETRLWLSLWCGARPAPPILAQDSNFMGIINREQDLTRGGAQYPLPCPHTSSAKGARTRSLSSRAAAQPSPALLPSPSFLSASAGPSAPRPAARRCQHPLRLCRSLIRSLGAPLLVPVAWRVCPRAPAPARPPADEFNECLEYIEECIYRKRPLLKVQ